MTEEEIKNTMDLQAKFAKAIFNSWTKSFKIKSTNAIK